MSKESRIARILENFGKDVNKIEKEKVFLAGGNRRKQACRRQPARGGSYWGVYSGGGPAPLRRCSSLSSLSLHSVRPTLAGKALCLRFANGAPSDFSFFGASYQPILWILLGDSWTRLLFGFFSVPSSRRGGGGGGGDSRGFSGSLFRSSSSNYFWLCFYDATLLTNHIVSTVSPPFRNSDFLISTDHLTSFDPDLFIRLLPLLTWNQETRQL